MRARGGYSPPLEVSSSPLEAILSYFRRKFGNMTEEDSIFLSL